MGGNNDQIDHCRLCLSRLDLRTPLAPLQQPDGMITQVREACGAGYHMVNGSCVRTAARRNAARYASSGWSLR